MMHAIRDRDETHSADRAACTLTPCLLPVQVSAHKVLIWWQEEAA
jgi:hypothetical protein